MSELTEDFLNHEPAKIEIAPAHDKRFCGRCQSWLPNAIEIHACNKAKRSVGYAWHEPDEPAFEKNSILTDGRKFKHGALIQEFQPQCVKHEA